MADKQAVRPIYSELQGYLEHAPNENKHRTIFCEEIWNHYNTSIEELMSVTNQDYNKYRLEELEFTVPNHLGALVRRSGMPQDLYRQKLSGIIARLHGEYFHDEPAPFESMPSTVIHQNQNQNQSVHIEFLLEMNNLINDKMNKAPEGTPEKKFLKKIRGGLSKVKNVGELLTLIMATGQSLNMSIEQLLSLFGG